MSDPEIVGVPAVVPEHLPAEVPEQPVDLVEIRDTYEGIAEVEFTDDERKALLAPVDRETEVDIRTDGIVYLPGVVLRRRLCAAIGPGQWGLKPESPPGWNREEEQAYYDGSLWIKGKFVARAVGQCNWRPSNKMMTRLDAFEGAKTDCLGRCCKDLGIGSELWLPGWAEKWKAECAERHGTKWQRKGSPTYGDERREQDAGAEDAAPGPPARGAAPAPAAGQPICPECAGPMWDNREERKQAEADYKSGKRKKKAPPAARCKKVDCGGLFWTCAEVFASMGGGPPAETATEADEPRTTLDSMRGEYMRLRKLMVDRKDLAMTRAEVDKAAQRAAERACGKDNTDEVKTADAMIAYCNEVIDGNDPAF